MDQKLYPNVALLQSRALETVCAPQTSAIHAMVTSAYGDAYRAPYRMDSKQLEHFQACFDDINRLVVLDPKNPRYSPHPIPRNFNYYGKMQIRTLTRRDKAVMVPSLCMGGKFMESKDFDHTCRLDDNIRDRVRIAQDLFAHGVTASGTTSVDLSRCCFNGVQNCYYQAPHAYSVDALYDIPQNDLLAAHIKHGTLRSVHYLFAPVELVCPMTAHVQSDFYKLRYLDDSSWLESGDARVRDRMLVRDRIPERRVQMSFGDNSHIYEHDYFIWSNYAAARSIIGVGFSLVAEITSRTGPYIRLEFTLINNLPPVIDLLTSGVTACRIRGGYIRGKVNTAMASFDCSNFNRLSRLYPRTTFPSRLDDYYKVPNFLKIILNGSWDSHFNVIQFDETKRAYVANFQTVPKPLVNNTLAYARALKKEEFTLINVTNFIRGKQSKIRFAGMLIQEEWGAHVDEVDALSVNLYIYAACRRYENTQGVSKLLKEIQDEQEGNAFGFLKSFLRNFSPSCVINESHDRHFMDAKILEFSTVLDVSNIVVVDTDLMPPTLSCGSLPVDKLPPPSPPKERKDDNVAVPPGFRPISRPDLSDSGDDVSSLNSVVDGNHTAAKPPDTNEECGPPRQPQGPQSSEHCPDSSPSTFADDPENRPPFRGDWGKNNVSFGTHRYVRDLTYDRSINSKHKLFTCCVTSTVPTDGLCGFHAVANLLNVPTDVIKLGNFADAYQSARWLTTDEVVELGTINGIQINMHIIDPKSTPQATVEQGNLAIIWENHHYTPAACDGTCLSTGILEEIPDEIIGDERISLRLFPLPGVEYIPIHDRKPAHRGNNRIMRHVSSPLWNAYEAPIYSPGVDRDVLVSDIANQMASALSEDNPYNRLVYYLPNLHAFDTISYNDYVEAYLETGSVVPIQFVPANYGQYLTMLSGARSSHKNSVTRNFKKNITALPPAHSARTDEEQQRLAEPIGTDDVEFKEFAWQPPRSSSSVASLVEELEPTTQEEEPTVSFLSDVRRNVSMTFKRVKPNRVTPFDINGDHTGGGALHTAIVRDIQPMNFPDNLTGLAGPFPSSLPCAPNKSAAKIIEILDPAPVAEYCGAPFGLLQLMATRHPTIADKLTAYYYEGGTAGSSYKFDRKTLSDLGIPDANILSYKNFDGADHTTEQVVYDVPIVSNVGIHFATLQRFKYTKLVVKVFAYLAKLPSTDHHSYTRYVYETFSPQYKYCFAHRHGGVRADSSEYYLEFTDVKRQSNINYAELVMNIYNAPSHGPRFDAESEFKLASVIIPADQQAFDNYMLDIQSLSDGGVKPVIIKRLSGFISKPIKVSINSSVAGSGKTHNIGKKYAGVKNTAFVTNNVKNESDAKAAGLNAMTILSFLCCKGTFKTIILDEAYSYPIGVVHACNAYLQADGELILIGDHAQIGHHDILNHHNDEAKLVDFHGHHDNDLTYRCPQDAVQLIASNCNVVVRSTSGVTRSVYFVENIEEAPCVTFMTPTANSKKALQHYFAGRKNPPNVYTIKEVMGSTFANTVLAIHRQEDAFFLKRQTEQLYVALSRHTNTLVMYGTKAHLEVFINVRDGIAQAIFAAGLSAYDDTFEYDKPATIKTKDALPAPLNILSAHAEEILSSTITAVNDDAALYQPIDKPTPTCDKSKLRFSINDLVNRANPKNTYRVTGRGYAKSYQSNDTQMAVYTLIKRYMRQTQNPSFFQAPKFRKLIIDGFLKLTGLTEHEFNCEDPTKNPLYISREELWKYCSDYLRSLQSKITTDAMMESLFATYIDLSKTPELEHFMKQQVKYIGEVGWDSKEKAGQGISAWPKNENILHSCYARALMDRISTILAHRNERVIISTGRSELENSQIVRGLIEDHYIPGHTPVFANDFSEWDSTNHRGLTDFESILMTKAGCPKLLVKRYVDGRRSWSQRMRTVNGVITVDGYDKQHSGQSYTLFSNTINCASLTCSLVDWDSLVLGLFKGDDSLLIARNVQLNSEAAKLIAACGQITKAELGMVPEFTGFVITELGYFPDVLRKTARIVSKSIPDRAYFDSLKLNVAADLAVVESAQQKCVGIAAATRHYNEKGIPINETEVSYLFDYLAHFNEIGFEQLKRADLNTVYV